MSAVGMTMAELRALPDRAAVLDAESVVWQKDHDQWCAVDGITVLILSLAELHRDRRPLALLFDGRRVVLADGQLPLSRSLLRTA